MRFNPRTHVPKLQHRRPKGRAAVRLNGRYHYVGQWGTPEAEAAYNALVRRWLDNGRRLPELDPSPLTVTELIVAFLKHADTHYRKAGRRTSEYACYQLALRPVRRLYGDTPAEDFGALALDTCRKELVKGGKRGPMVRSSVNKMTSRIRTVFRWAAGRELVPADVVTGLEMLPPLLEGRTEAKEAEPVTAVPDADVEAVRAAVEPQIRAMIDLQLWSACRPGEAVALRGRDLDTAGLTIGDVRVWVYNVPAETNKTDHHETDRVVYLGPQAQDVVRPFLQGDPSAPLFAGKRENGRAYTVSGYRTAIRAACEKVWPTGRFKKWPLPEGLKEKLIDGKLTKEQADAAAEHHWHPHQLRHNAAERLERAHGIEVAQYVLGHSKPDTTRIYSAAHKLKAAEAMSRSG